MSVKLGLPILAIIILFSCNKRGDRNNPLSIENKIKPNDNTFQLSIDVKSNDKIPYILYYKDGSNEWFDEDHTIWQNGNGGENFQRVIFNFEEGKTPTDLRLDIGTNEFKNLQPIEIGAITITYNGKEVSVTQDKLAEYFTHNQFITYDSISKKFILNKDNEGKYDPFFESTSKTESILKSFKD